MDSKGSFRDIHASLAVVLNGSVANLEALLEELRNRRDVRLVYIRTSAGRLKIVDDDGGAR